ncbi:eCIS core domain-containing protein [Streptomyces collinus]|uniref:eCIS core domain-containing protein n=1 Tax=Streptomyces collinus TaxID=42684 RepID=UPI0037F29647
MSNSHTQDGRSERSAEQRRRKRKERAARSRAPEPREIVSGAGQPLDPGVRRELEERLGHDLSRVRLHTGRDAGRLADLLGADAVAVGQDILFREGAYRPGTDEGRRLLAHELLHTVQNPHGLGALRAGRDLGAVSLPQQAIEREAETAARDLVRDAGPGAAAAAPDVEEGQATPGWLRYATVDADRRRMEQLDPATLVDRIAGGLLRSLRGDPEDRSGRVRVQLARMAPEVQDSVLDRLELRLPAPVVDRLLESVEETQDAGPLPLDAAAAPHALPGATEEIEEERAREDSEEADGGPERDERRQEPGRQGGGPEDTRGDGSGETADREQGANDSAGQREGAEGSDGQRQGAEGTAGQHQGADGSAARQQAGVEDEQERSSGRQEEKDASGRDARQDADDERRDASDTERDQRDQDRQDERDAGEEQGGAQDEAAPEPERQAVEQERRPDAGATAGRQATAPGSVDRSGAEPGEKSRTGGDGPAVRTPGDPENEQDAGDEPLGLDAEPVRDDSGRETGDDTASAAGQEPVPEADLVGYTEAAKNPGLVEERRKGTAPPPGLPAASDAPAPEPATQEPRPDRDTAPRSEEEDSGGDSFESLLSDLSDGRQAADPNGLSGALAPASSGTPQAEGSGADPERKQSVEGKEDSEAARRDAEARNADGAAARTVTGPGETAAPDQLAKAGEDARTQGSGTPSGTGTDTGGESRAPSAQSAQKPEAGAPDRSGAKQDGSGSSGSAGADKGQAKQAGKPEGGPADGRREPAGDQGQGTTPPAPETSPGGAQDAAEGHGPATTPGPQSGPDKVSTPGPASAPKLAPGNGPSPMAAGPEPKTNTPKATESPGPGGGSGGGSAGSRSRPAGGKRQAARQAAKTVSRRGRGAGGGRTSPAPASVRSGGRPSASGGSKASPKAKKEAPAPDVSNATPESGLSTAAGLKPHQALETLKGVDSAVGRSVDKERTALRKAPPTTQRPVGSPRTVPGGPKAAAPGTYTNAKVARTEAAPGKTPEISGEQKPQGEVPGANVPEPSWWDIAVTVGAQLFGKLLKEILPLDDLIDSILGLPTKDEGLRNARVGDAPRLPLENDSDPQRTDEQGRKLDERKDELHRSGREDAARPMGEDQIYPDVPKETLTGKVAGGKKGAKGGGTRSVSGGGVPIESASAVAEHDRGPQIRAGFSQGRQKMGQERQTKEKKAADDREQHDRDLQKEVTASGKKQSDTRDKGRSDIAGSRDRWRREQDDKVSEIDGKKGKKYDKVRDDIKKKEEDTDKDVDKRTEDDNKKIDDEQTNAEKEAEKKQEDGKDDADNWLEEAIEKLKEFFETLKNAIKSVFEKARQVVTDLIDTFKQQVFKLIDDARNWVIDQINTFADALIALGDELLADYPAMRDKWRNTIDGARDWAVQKVNEAADALKEVAGKLLDGLCGALLAGLDALEGGLLAAVDIAETVTVGALEFGAAAVAALGEWAAIFNDIVSDPGDWIGKAGAAAETGAKEHLFEEVKTAVRAWFNQKVQEIIGIPLEDFQELISGGVSVEQMAQMAWDEALPQLPVIIGVMVVEKVVAKLIPGAGWVMAVIDALQTAWGALSEILAAFGLFMDFLKSVKSGNGALPFAKAVAAGVVALLELIYEFLVEGVSRFMGKVAERLGTMLKNLRTKRKPGRSDAPSPPDAPTKPRDDSQGRSDDRTPSSPSSSPDRPADRADGRPPARPRTPSADKTSRPPSRPRPGKRSTPEKKPRPAAHGTRPKKRRDDDERRDEGREVNAARRRMRDAERRLKDDDRPDTRPDTPTRRGPARDTLRPDQRRTANDRDRDRDGKDTRPTDRRGDGPGAPGARRRDEDRRPDHRRDDDRRPDRRDDDRRRDTEKDRPRRRPLRRARQTVKSAVNRARRAAAKLFGKARRRIGNRLNDRLHKLREQWRRRNDRTGDRTPHRDRRRSDRRDRKPEETTWEQTMPRVSFRNLDGEAHTLMFRGRGPTADMVVRSQTDPVTQYLDEWAAEAGQLTAYPDRQSRQLEAIRSARAQHVRAEQVKRRLPPRGTTTRSGELEYRALRGALGRLARLLELREIDPSRPPLLPMVLPPYTDGVRGHGFQATGINKSIKSHKGEKPSGNPKIPLGWDLVPAPLRKDTAWVRMHLFTEKFGGKATGSNLVPAPGTPVNSRFAYRVELPAFKAITKDPSIAMIWYNYDVSFYTGADEYFPKKISMAWGKYAPAGNTWRKQPSEGQYTRDNIQRPNALDSRFDINGKGPDSIRTKFGVSRAFAQALRDQSPYRDIYQLIVRMKAYKKRLAAASPGKLRNFDSELKAVVAKKNDIRFT